MSSKKILITGGMGNLGSWLTEHFVQQGFDVTILTRKARTLEGVQGFKTVYCDIANEADCKEKIAGLEIEYVVHCASVNDGFVPGYSKLALEVNTWGTRNLLEALKEKSVKHFIYFSTFQVYGKYSGHISEETPLETRNDYGLTHLFAECYVKEYYYNHQLPYTIVRLTNSYGCPKDYESSKWYLVLNDLARSAFEKKQIVLKSNGLSPRDFIWMSDVCQIVEKLCDIPATHDVYNISGERTFKMLEIAQAVQEAYQETYGEEIPLLVNKEDNTVYSDDLVVSASKLKRLIPYEAHPHFKEEAVRIFTFLSIQPSTIHLSR
jgi:nucleoside-diphosphate-sugar epimerase